MFTDRDFCKKNAIQTPPKPTRRPFPDCSRLTEYRLKSSVQNSYQRILMVDLQFGPDEVRMSVRQLIKKVHLIKFIGGF